MADVITYQRFWQRRDTAANWTSANPTLASGEFGYETDTKKLKMGDGATAWNSLAYQLNVDAPSDGNEYVRKNAAWTIASGGAGSEGFMFCENFLRGILTSTASGTSFVANEWRPVAYTSGAGATGVLDAPGVLIKTGSAVNGLVNLFATAGLRLKPGREIQKYGCRVELPVLSDGTHSFTFTFGLRSAITGAEANDIIVSYTHSANSGHWTLRTTASSVAATTNASVGPAAGVETDLEIEINTACTEVKLYVDGALATTNTTNVPNAAMGLGCLIIKTLGATERTARIVRMWRR